MKALVSIIMGSTSDYPVMEKAANFFNEMENPFEINALSAHRTPEEVEKFAKNATSNGIKVIIAGAGMAAHLPGVIAAMTPIPVIGVPIKASFEPVKSILPSSLILRFFSTKDTYLDGTDLFVIVLLSPARYFKKV